MKTTDAVQEFLLSRSGLSPKTIRGYRQHLGWFQGSFPELPSSPQPIQAWLSNFQGLAPETVHARFRTLRAFYNQTCRWHPEVPNPMPLVRPPKINPKVMRTFSDQDLLSLFTLPLCPRDRALFTLMLDIGPRAQEVANLTWDDISPCFVLLNGKTGERMVPISQVTYQAIEALRPERHQGQHIFMGRQGALAYMGIYKLVRRLCRQANITGRRASPHTFRHTFGTNYAASREADIKTLQEILGHRDLKTTMRYIHNNPRRIAENHRLCSPLKALAGAAQGMLIKDEAIKEFEAIVNKRK